MAELQETSKVEVIVYTTKSDKTLKQNMNAKDESLRKRTSLIIVPQQVEVQADELDGDALMMLPAKEQLVENGNRNSITSMDSCLSSQSNQSNHDENEHHAGSCSGSGTNCSSSSSSSSEDAHAAYQDLQNGNGNGVEGNVDGNTTLHSPSCSSSTSESTESCCSSVDYSLREQLQNFANCSELKCVNDLPTAGRLLKGMSLPMEQSSPHCDALLSPQEVPLGRRYAEVAQFKALGKAR